MTFIRICLFMCAATLSILLSPSAVHSGTIPEMQLQITDFRLLFHDKKTLEDKIARLVCSVEPRGRVWVKGGAPLRVYEMPLTNALTVGELFAKLEISTNELAGIQVRLFKKNLILQTGRSSKQQATDLAALSKVSIEAGDIVYFTAEE